MNNAEGLSIQGWPAVWGCAAEVVAWKQKHMLGLGGALEAEVDLGKDALPDSSWKNTVTVTRKVRTSSVHT